MIRVYSEPGIGTTVKLFLPIDESQTPKQEDKKIYTPPRGKGHVLVVDDEKIIRNFAAYAIENLGYTVSTCKDGLDAVEFFKDQP